MDPQKVFDIYDKLFATEGWKDLVADFNQRKVDIALHLVNSDSDEKELYKAKGICHVYNYIINLENTMESSKKLMADAEQDSRE